MTLEDFQRESEQERGRGREGGSKGGKEGGTEGGREGEGADVECNHAGPLRHFHLIRNCPPLGPYGRNMLRALWWSYGVGVLTWCAMTRSNMARSPGLVFRVEGFGL